MLKCVLTAVVSCMAEGLVRSKDARDVSASLSLLMELALMIIEIGVAQFELFHNLVAVRLKVRRR